jgi:hypothetical protein
VAKPGKQAERKREKQVVDLSIQPAPDPPPIVIPAGLTTEDEAVLPAWSCIEGWEAQVVQRTVRSVQTGQLTDFAVSLQTRPEGSDEGWSDVERVDCAHGSGVHVDQYKADGTKKKVHEVVPDDCRKSLDKALTWALDYIWDVERRTTGWV